MPINRLTFYIRHILPLSKRLVRDQGTRSSHDHSKSGLLNKCILFIYMLITASARLRHFKSHHRTSNHSTWYNITAMDTYMCYLTFEPLPISPMYFDCHHCPLDAFRDRVSQGSSNTLKHCGHFESRYGNSSDLRETFQLSSESLAIPFRLPQTRLQYHWKISEHTIRDLQWRLRLTKTDASKWLHNVNRLSHLPANT